MYKTKGIKHTKLHLRKDIQNSYNPKRDIQTIVITILYIPTVFIVWGRSPLSFTIYDFGRNPNGKKTELLVLHRCIPQLELQTVGAETPVCEVMDGAAPP